MRDELARLLAYATGRDPSPPSAARPRETSGTEPERTPESP